MNNSVKSEKSVGNLIKTTDFPTLLSAVIASVYGLCLVYSATYSSLDEGQVIGSDVRSMFVSIAGGLFVAIVVSNIDYDIISKL